MSSGVSDFAFKRNKPTDTEAVDRSEQATSLCATTLVIAPVD
jgi:hypothetical protein